MDVTTLYSIGELSRRTGLPVRTIRFYSDAGVVAPTTRSPAGYRLYDVDALLRLELLRTLRELGMDLATVRRVLDRELSVADVAAAHADALDVQIRVLHLRRSVLRAVAEGGSGPEETKRMHRLTQLSGEERRRLIDDFVEGTFGTSDAAPAAVAMVRAATPDLPDDPSSEQVEAWAELAELVGDEDFRARMRRTAVYQATGRTLDIESEAGEELMDLTRQKVSEAQESGIDPLGDRGARIVDDLVHRFAAVFARTPDTEFRDWMAEQFEEAHDPRVDRYWRLVWIVNGWQVVPSLVPMYPWLIRALRNGHEVHSPTWKLPRSPA
ncbi:MerR family transcriptional regulator [Streptomyces xanthophaeus]|uniref:MerR family transcriptional regulator n=1 Tax=Streptomyces xanthophaeus TaxID=67385 RepID=UPI002647AAE8|nr:MerR family transcriptional regulator [Streptomyces xanthophaeus]WKD36774.1 MerR family transcriptional regulator [Streptomyces xanthophaeus]